MGIRGRRKLQLIVMLLAVLLFTAVPVMALAAESGPLVQDALVRQVESSGISMWFETLAIIVGAAFFLYGQYKKNVLQGKMAKLDFITSIIPDVHGYVQKLRKSNPKLDKALAFTDKIDDALRAVKLLPLTAEEKIFVRDRGAGYHTEFKEMRGSKTELGKPSIVLNLPSQGSTLYRNGPKEPYGLETMTVDTKNGDTSGISF